MKNKKGDKYPEYIYQAIRQRLQPEGIFDENDYSYDERIDKFSKKKVLKEWLNWEGLIGWGDSILYAIDEIWGTNLAEDDE